MHGGSKVAQSQSKATQDQVVQTIERWFRPQWFARFRNEDGWSAQKLFWMDVLINWAAGHTLTERFVAARDLLKQLKPHWHVPSSLSGFTAARLRIELVISGKAPRFAVTGRARNQTARQSPPNNVWLRSPNVYLHAKGFSQQSPLIL